MTRKGAKHSNSHDDKLFRAATGDVEPLKQTRRHHHGPLPKLSARSRRDDDRPVEESPEKPAQPVDPGDDAGMDFQRPQVSRGEMRQLRRGRYRVQDEIDLHGLTAREAQSCLSEFITDCASADRQCVRVVHGKGHRSGPAGPVLKGMVNQLLRTWDEVIAFCPALPRDGGSGAVYVLLRRL